MAERDTFVTVSDGDQLNEGYFNGILTKFDDYPEDAKLSADQTGGSVSNSTTETKIGEVQIPADTVNNGVLVIVTGKYRYNNDGTGATIKLRAGTSSTATSNTIIKTITRNQSGTSSFTRESGWTMVYYIDSLTWSSLNYIHVTGKMGAANPTFVTTCESIQVIGF